MIAPSPVLRIGLVEGTTRNDVVVVGLGDYRHLRSCMICGSWLSVGEDRICRVLWWGSHPWKE